MATVIRIEAKRRWPAALLAVSLAVQPVAQAAEREITITTGPDGVEIFSNLPGDFGDMPDPPMLLGGRAVASVAALPGAIRESEMPTPDQSPQNELPEIGKSFLLDD